MKVMALKIIQIMVVALMLTSCDLTHVREKDLPLLKEEAVAGNLRAKKALVRTSRSGLPEATLKSYETDLLEIGDKDILDRKMKRFGIMEEADNANNLKWLIYGAEHGNSDYMVQLGEYYRDAQHPDQEKATYWYRRAADSLNLDARMAWIKWRGGEQLLDRPSRAFAEQWKVKAKDSNLFGRISCSIGKFGWNFLIGSFSVLFSKSYWWHGIIGLIIMLSGLLLLFGVCNLSVNYVEEAGFVTCLPIILSCLYGLVNGLASFGEEGYYIGRFERQAGMCGTLSDLCIYGTWIWLLGFFITLAISVSLVSRKQGNVVAYILFAILGSFICYIASMMAVIIFMILFVVAMAFLLYFAANYKPNNYVIKGGGSWGQDVKASKYSNGQIIDNNDKEWRETSNGEVTEK